MNHSRLYEYRFRDVPQERRSAAWAVLAPELSRLLGSPTRLLDPAAGRCEFINAAPAAERWAVDAVEHAETETQPDVRLLIGDAMTVELPAAYFDGILVSNFLEHLGGQDEVAAFLERMHTLTVPGARIGVLGPNFRHCAGRYFDFADHTVPLTERSVAEHLYAAGFEPTIVRARFLPYSFTGRLPAHPALVRAYLRMPPAWRLFGKQYLVLAQRP
ncbi:MAG: class I SAM-dependent methyltransferase [Solirubrobacteraceae bacterium]